MAQQVTSDTNIAPVLKNWYTDKKFENLIGRGSPVLQRIQKNRVGGATYNFAALYGFGGACSADWTVAIAQATTQARNVNFSVPPGYLFSVFNISVVEKFASRDEKGAYVKLVVDKMFAATEALRKQFAAALYASGYGEFGNVPAGGVASAATTATLPSSAIQVIDVGTVFDVTVDANGPSSNLDNTGPFTVSAINGLTITFTPAVGTAWVAGAYLEFHGGRDSGGKPNYPSGFSAWYPTVGGRTGSAWTTLIGTSFYGVTRSTNVGRLAGWYYKRGTGQAGANETYSSAVSVGVQLVRRAGGIPRLVVLNDNDYMYIQNELQSFRNYWQSVDLPDGRAPDGGPKYVFGLKELQFAFSSTYIEVVYDDPICPQGTCYIIDDDQFEFASLTNPNLPTIAGPKNNNPGVPEVTGESDPTENPFQLNIEDFLNIIPSVATPTGPAAQVTLMVIGNFASHNPAHVAVVQF